MRQVSPCLHCAGKGVHVKDRCKKCDGVGQVDVDKKIDISIPAGVDDGYTLKVEGEGGAGSSNSGDLYVVISVKESVDFFRKGPDIYTEENIGAVLAIIGGLFVLETVSVIIQVVSFKLTGKRIFQMAPLHHHFEKKGWAESTVVIRFWIISIILALIGLATLKLR